MQYHSLPLLQIHSDIHGLVKINDTPAGETKNGAITLPVAFGSALMLSFTPLENDKNGFYLPFTRQLLLMGELPGIVSDDGCIRLCAWPDNMYELTLMPPKLLPNPTEIPHILTSLEYYAQNKQYTAFVYFDRTVNFAVEETITHKMLFAYALDPPLDQITIQFKRLQGKAFLFVSGMYGGEKYLLAVNAGVTISFCFFEKHMDYQIAEESVTLYQDIGEPFGKMLELTYTVKDDILALSESRVADHSASGAPQSPENIAKSFVLAVKYGLSEYALPLLLPALREDLTFPDLQDFFGNFECITENIFPGVFGETGIALRYKVSEYVSATRVFLFEFVDQAPPLISNITEK